ncbi:hypothetical protein [Rhizomonospora bruguierae]|uniref:hypothetical protein n=1 Tax=Rhizomonospora bruguierae TaxID=1581705 RepID=UPI001BD16317|nr:hypothetical protein [Micromonospora sp. NBRC 107566]
MPTPGQYLNIPDAVAELVTGRPGLDQTEQAFPFLTTDPAGFPHVALLSRTEVEVAADRRRLVAALASTRTSQNVLRTGRATLIAVGGTTAHYVKLTLVGHHAAPGLLGCEFAVVDAVADSIGIELSPILFQTSADLARSEHWDRTAALLSTLLTRSS